MNKKIPKRLLAVAMAAMTAVTVSVPAFAESFIVNTPSNNEVQVQSSVASNFTVTIPKAVVLTKASGSGTGEYTAAFDATVTGDIGELETVYVTPDASVTLTSDNAGATVVATTTVGTTEFARDAILGQTATGTYNLTAQLTPGTWSGAMNVAISLKEKGGGAAAKFDTTDAWMSYYTVDSTGRLFLQPDFKAALSTNVDYKDWKAGTPLPAIPESANGKKVTSLLTLFMDCKMNSLDLSSFNMTNIEDVGKLFWGCTNLTSVNLAGWDTSAVKYMEGMFHKCSSLTSIDLSELSCESVISTDDMFSQCTSLKSVNLGGMKSTNLTNINSMFSYCYSLETVNMAGWDFSHVTNFGSAFRECRALTSLDLSGWNTKSCTNFSSMFYGCTNITTLNLKGWNTGSAYIDQTISAGHMFYECPKLTTIDVTNGIWTLHPTTQNGMLTGSPNAKIVYNPA